MKISKLFADPARKLFSFELFPPKTDAGQLALERTIRDLAELSPAFVSVTYGAGGSTRAKTLELVQWIEREARLCAMAHLTCVGATEAEIAAVLDKLVDAGIENVMALRGDPPAGQERFERTAGGFAFAADLVAFIRKRYGQKLCLGGAGNPEGHLECRDIDQDIRHLKAKVDAGLDFVVTQLFFDNRFYFDFVARARSAGIQIPIVPGLMPIRTLAGIERMTKLSGASIPPRCRRSSNAAATTRRRPSPSASPRRPPRPSSCSTAARPASTSTR